MRRVIFMLNEEELEVFGMCENVDHEEMKICNMKAEIEKMRSQY